MSRFVVIALLTAASPALAAERTLGLTDFDRVRVDGSFVVEIVTGRAASARISGPVASVDAASVVVQGRTLTIRRSQSAWGGFPGATVPSATIRVTVPALQSIWVSGPGSVTVDRLRSARLSLALEGSGALSVDQASADRLDIALAGAGRIAIAGGSVGNLTATLRGSGDLDARGLVAADAKLRSETAGNLTVGVRRSADVVSTGAGGVTVLGSPACTVNALGSGQVVCGKSAVRP